MTSGLTTRPAATAAHAAQAASTLPRILWRAVGEGSDLAAHLRRHGPPPRCGSDAARDRVIAQVEAAAVLGRGGAGFPMARKLRSIGGRRRHPVVVGNGTEGEPASDKDKVLLVQAAHLVADGASIAAQVVGADSAILVVPALVLPTVQAAVDERRSAGFDPVEIRVEPSAGGFVAGEASAVVGWLERGVPLPHMTPPRLADRGLEGRPTLVHNVETLAQLALVARHGAEWFRQVGTPSEPGSMLVTLCGAVDRPGVREVPIGVPLLDLLQSAGVPAGTGPVLVGGYSGAWLSEEEWPRLRLSRQSLQPVGASPGAGLIASLPPDRCGLIETARVVRYLAGESAGQCGPCLFGLDAVAQEFERIAHSRDGDVARLRRWVGQVDGRGACSHPDGVARLVRSALRVFAEEVAHHRTGWCRGTSADTVLPVPGERERR